MASKDFSATRATSRLAGMSEEEIRFGGTSTSPAPLAKHQTKPERKACIILDDDLYRRIKKYLASGSARHRNLSEMVRALVDAEIRRAGF